MQPTALLANGGGAAPPAALPRPSNRRSVSLGSRPLQRVGRGGSGAAAAAPGLRLSQLAQPGHPNLLRCAAHGDGHVSDTEAARARAPASRLCIAFCPPPCRVSACRAAVVAASAAERHGAARAAAGLEEGRRGRRRDGGRGREGGKAPRRREGGHRDDGSRMSTASCAALLHPCRGNPRRAV
eukprot:359650-Chlamydomonas_euryale.AAC.19